MPEIPEIETIRRHLEQSILKKGIVDIELTREKTFNYPKEKIYQYLSHTQVTKVLRRGKIILLQFNRPLTLLFHFMLEGYLQFIQPQEIFNEKYQLMLKFITGEKLYFCKMYLGYINLETTLDIKQIPQIKELGPDPISRELTVQQFQKMLSERRKMIKPLLMDQDFLAGIGNTYSNEGLFKAGILPDKKANRLNPEETTKLYHELRSLLQRATQMGGVGDKPFSSTDQLTGGFIPQLKVSYRQGQPCYICGTPISHAKIGERNAFFCKRCQH